MALLLLHRLVFTHLRSLIGESCDGSFTRGRSKRKIPSGPISGEIEAPGEQLEQKRKKYFIALFVQTQQLAW